MDNNFYDILNINQDASMKEIKKAYYKLVRKYPPEKHPEEFKKIRSAYETLSDEQARKDYDAREKYGEEIKKLFDTANKNIKNEEYDDAIKKLKRILVLNSTMDTARNLLGICYANKNDYKNAIKIFEQLTVKNKNVALYWLNLGDVYLKQKEYGEARNAFEKAIDIESFNSTPYLRIAESYKEENNFVQSLDWAEKAVHADGKVDFDDFEALFFKCFVYILQNKAKKIEKEAKRILKIIENNKLESNKNEVKSYVAFRFADLGKVLYQQNAYEMATLLFNSAIKFDPNNSKLKRMLKESEKAYKLFKAFNELKNDEYIINPIKRYVAFNLSTIYGNNLKNKEATFENIMDELKYYSPNQIINSIDVLQNFYLEIYKLNKDFYKNMKVRLKNENDNAKSKKKKSNKNLIIASIVIIIFVFMAIGSESNDTSNNYSNQNSNSNSQITSEQTTWKKYNIDNLYIESPFSLTEENSNLSQEDSSIAESKLFSYRDDLVVFEISTYTFKSMYVPDMESGYMQRKNDFQNNAEVTNFTSNKTSTTISGRSAIKFNFTFNWNNSNHNFDGLMIVDGHQIWIIELIYLEDENIEEAKNRILNSVMLSDTI